MNLEEQARFFRGKEIFKPLKTGRLDGHVFSIREYNTNLFLYAGKEHVIMIDAGYNNYRLKQKMEWIGVPPSSVQHILLTHTDPDHVGGVEYGSSCIPASTVVYLSHEENRYLTGEARRLMYHGYLRPSDINRRIRLLSDGEEFYFGSTRVEAILLPGHTFGHMAYLIDETYLFTGDAIWLGVDGGYSFIDEIAEDSELAKTSLRGLERNLKSRNQPVKVVTSHTGWSDDLDFVFSHIDQFCNPWKCQIPHDPKAPYDSFDESDEEGIDV